MEQFVLTFTQCTEDSTPRYPVIAFAQVVTTHKSAAAALLAVASDYLDEPPKHSVLECHRWVDGAQKDRTFRIEFDR